jgi:site-specific recombinase XerD
MKDNRALPVVMSKIEISRMLRCATNIKHRTMFSTMYATGMRPVELLNLRVNDIHKHDKVIHVRHGKGGKDRYVMLSDPLLGEMGSGTSSNSSTPLEHHKTWLQKIYGFH